MAPTLDNDAQFRFLISCIKHSTGGRPDFAAVATDCEIVSKAAAAKRFERLMKAHDITNKTALAGIAGDVPGAPSSTPATPAAKGAGAKGKNKRQAVDDDSDIEEVDTPVKKTPAKKTPVKKEAASAKKDPKVKQPANKKVKLSDIKVKDDSDSPLSDAPDNVEMKDPSSPITTKDDAN